MLIERFVVRPFVRAGSNGWLMSTVAVGIVLEQVVMFTFGKEPRTLALPVSGEAFTLGGLAVSPLQIAILVVAIAVAVGLHAFAQRTRYGKALLAIVQNPQAASLMGIDVTRAVMYCYAASTVLAGIAGILIAPLFSVSAEMGTLFGLKAFAVAILGGLSSARGVVLAGLPVRRRRGADHFDARLGVHQHPRVPAGHRHAGDQAARAPGHAPA